MGDSSVTTSISHYDGIFKFVHTKEAQVPFLKARKYLSQGNWEEAALKLSEALRKCRYPSDKQTVELVQREISRHKSCQISVSISSLDQLDWSLVEKRSLEKMEEYLDLLPQSVFILYLALPISQGTTVRILGRKTLSRLWIEDKIPELFCSQIRADMLMGLLEDWRITESKFKLFYRPFTPSEKLSIYGHLASALDAQSDIVFPVPLVKAVTRKEFTSPAEGWDIDVNFDHSLTHGEEHIRQFTISTLQSLKLTSHRLYDPACSTGVFLATLKQAFPNCTTIGQDLSQKMCSVARTRVDEVHCGNAMVPQIPPGSADVVFNRFLNSEVVTSSDAELLFTALLPTVAIGGVMITFGHTPVLLSSAHFQMIDGFELLSCIGVATDSSSIFQYYIIKRVKKEFKCFF